MPGGPEFDKDHWRNDPIDGLYDYDALLRYMLRGSDQLRGWNCNEIGDPVLVRLLEMGLWDGTYPNNKYAFNLCHSTGIATHLLPRIMALEKQVGDSLSKPWCLDLSSLIGH